MPPIWPRIQLFGSCLGQFGSTLYSGPSARAGADAAKTMASTVNISLERSVIAGRPPCQQRSSEELRRHIRREFLNALSGVDFARVEIAVAIGRHHMHPVELA